MEKSLAYMAEAVRQIKDYWKEYGVNEETIADSWGNASPPAGQVEALYDAWRKLYAKLSEPGLYWSSPLNEYVDVGDRYPDLFSNTPTIVKKKSDL